jgi:hypothetical protein
MKKLVEQLGITGLSEVRRRGRVDDAVNRVELDLAVKKCLRQSSHPVLPCTEEPAADPHSR